MSGVLWWVVVYGQVHYWLGWVMARRSYKAAKR